MVLLGWVALSIAGPTFFVGLTKRLLRRSLWGVGSRLLISFLLLGVLPIPFLLGLAYATAYIVSGQLAARRMEGALKERASALSELARKFGDGGGAVLPAENARARLAELNRALPEPLPGVSISALGAAAALPASPVPSPPLFISRVSGELRLNARESRPSRSVLLSVPLGEALRNLLESRTGIAVRFFDSESGSSIGRTPAHGGIQIGDGAGTVHLTPEPTGSGLSSAVQKESPAGHGPLGGRWLTWGAPIPFPLLDIDTGIPVPNRKVVFVVQSSLAREWRELFGGTQVGGGTGSKIGTIVVRTIQGLAVVVAAVYFGSALIAALLVLRIARATSRLSTGFAAIEKGDFSYRGELKGHDQLAGMVQGFNAMAAHLDASVAERAEREAVKRELQLARDLQRRLLPAFDFACPGFEIAIDFRPADQIGGDFYDLTSDPDGGLTVVVADVSGHGLATGIVMASAKASLSALSTLGSDAPSLLAHLDRELRRATDARTFVTLGHLKFDRRLMTVEFTNAGHLYPYRIEEGGRLSDVKNPARPLGLNLPVTFRTVTSPLSVGDIWVAFSDGVIEGRSPGGEEFGFARLETLLAAGAGKSADELKDSILAEWRSFTRHDVPEDDRTLLVLKVLEIPDASVAGPIAG